MRADLNDHNNPFDRLKPALRNIIDSNVLRESSFEVASCIPIKTGSKFMDWQFADTVERRRQKIDYYDKAVEYGSEDAAAPDLAHKVMKIMLAEEC